MRVARVPNFVDQVGRAFARPRYVLRPGLNRADSSIEPYRTRLGWTIPWFSSTGTDFNRDFGVTADSVFLRVGDDVYRTYFTVGRGASS
jgi:hypothetical protein